MLRDVYDLPHEAIAAELGITESAAKVRLHRARRKLRERLFPLPGDEATRRRACGVTSSTDAARRARPTATSCPTAGPAGT